MAAEILSDVSRAADANNSPYSGAKWFFYDTGTTTPVTTYTDAALTTAHANPVVADSGGEFAPIYFDAGSQYRGILKNSDESVTLKDIDPINTGVLSQLAGTAGAAQIGSAGPSNVQLDINDLENADTALDGRLNAVETLKPTGEGTALALAAALKPIPAGPRDAIQYVANNRVSFTRKTATMGGFRYKGQYQKTGRQPSFPINGNVANVSTMQAALSALKFEAWYAIFVVADDDDTQAEIKVMPYLRLAAPSGGSADIIAGGENVTDLTATASHSWTSTDNLAGTDCLVIHETKIFSGRTASITANSATSITLDDMGSLDAGDFILPAPPGYDHYCYIGSFYLDGSEVRNIADNGVGASSRAVNHSSATGSGTVTTYEEIDWRGYICPLATGIVINLTQTLNTGSTGELLQRMSIDSSNHDVWEKYETKGYAAVKRCWEPRIDLDFGQSSSTWYQNAGSLTAQTTSRQFEIRGWKEP